MHHVGKQIAQLTPIDGHIREHFIADPRERAGVRRGRRTSVHGGDNFAECLGHMELNMAGFLITPRRDVPLTLIKPLRIPPGLHVE